MTVPLPEACYHIVSASVSGGYVVALAVICLLQYVAYLHRLNLVRREKDTCRRELNGVASQLNSLKRDQELSQFENDVLREFLSERNGEQALRRFLKRLVPDASTGWAALLRHRDIGWCVAQSCGLSDESVEALQWDPAFERSLANGASLRLTGEALAHSDLGTSLTAADRARTGKLYIFGMANGLELEGALATTALLPHDIEESLQVACVERLVTGLSGSLRDRWRLDSQQRRLDITAEMLALRSVADRHFDSPAAMLSELVHEASARTRAQRAALYLYLQSPAGGAQALVRTGETLSPTADSQWQEFEHHLADYGRNLQSIEHYSGDDLKRFGVESLIGAALLVPVLRRRRTVGLLCFTRTEPEEFCDAQRQLGSWAANLLAEMLPRAVNHAVATRQARLDPLTGLANRGAFDRCGDEAVRHARDNHGECSLLFLDLDRFKSINDCYGHRGGDAVLRAIAQIVRDGVQQIRANDREAGAASFVARYGGEELAVLLPGLGREASRRIGESIRARLEATPIEFDGTAISVTTSIGLATFPEHADTIDELIAAADAALYLAKCAGRNRLEVADQALSVAATAAFLPVVP